MSHHLLPPPEEKLIRKRIAQIPLLQAVEQRLGLKAILSRYLKPHGNEMIPAVEVLMLLVFNIACGRQPLYELDNWTNQLDAGLLHADWKALSADPSSDDAQDFFNDDRFGRVLDKLFEVDRSSLITDIAVRVIQATGVDLSQLHNDSTSVKTTGKMPGKTRTGVSFTHGHSKDHRPDLKQVIYNLTISSDGAIPIHFKTYSGNTSDDTTHIETWNALSKIAGRTNFVYVADCKVCTDKQLSHIVDRGGRIVTIMPKTWKEVDLFKEQQRQEPVSKEIILIRQKDNNTTKNETYYRLISHQTTQKRGYNVHWIYSPEKHNNDAETRENKLQKAEKELASLSVNINRRNLKTREQILRRAQKVLNSHHVERFYELTLGEVAQSERVQKGKGRPGRDTQYYIVAGAKLFDQILCH